MVIKMENKLIDESIQLNELRKLSKEELVKLLLIQVRNIWRVDGLYFLGIEKRFGVKAAAEIDKETWETLAVIEAKDLKRTFGKEEIENIREFMDLLRRTGWALYQKEEKIEIEENEAIFKVTRCKIQETRLKKGLEVFPCKPVRLGYLKKFVETLSPNIKVEVIRCPPDEKDPHYWCAWKFTLEK